MKNFIIAVAMTASVTLSATVADANSKVRIPDTTFEDNAQIINLSNGHSTIIQLANGKYISSVWIDDPGLLGAATDRPLCEGGGNSSGDCGFAQTVRLVPADGLDIPGQSYYTPNGMVTFINLIVNDANGNDRDVYQFEVRFTGISGGVSLLSIVPGSERNTPSNTLTLPNRMQILSGDLDPLRAGMANAIASGRADESSDAWKNLLRFVDLIEAGDTTIVEAIRESDVNTRLISELEKMSSSESSVI